MGEKVLLDNDGKPFSSYAMSCYVQTTYFEAFLFQIAGSGKSSGDVGLDGLKSKRIEKWYEIYIFLVEVCLIKPNQSRQLS